MICETPKRLFGKTAKHVIVFAEGDPEKGQKGMARRFAGGRKKKGTFDVANTLGVPVSQGQGNQLEEFERRRPRGPYPIVRIRPSNYFTYNAGYVPKCDILFSERDWPIFRENAVLFG